ncbi:MAG: hypothetical protein KA118_20560 [Verrucomicrobia bacterium]|nr:hypothetical protein [Verrucomicrobiota bacterium]
MKLRLTLPVLLAVGLGTVLAAVPPPDQLLPSDALAMWTVPDWSRAGAALSASPSGRLWQDPSMQAFKAKVMAQFESMRKPLESELGVSWAQYAALLKGQVTWALTRLDPTSDRPSLDWVGVLDAGDQGDRLKQNLAELRQKWTDSGKTLRTRKVRDVEFMELTFTGQDIQAVFRRAFGKESDSADTGGGSTDKMTLLVGQSQSALLIGTAESDLEKILARLGGGSVRGLADEPEFQSRMGMFRQSMAYGWINLKTLVAMAKSEIIKQSGSMAANPMMPSPDKLLGALGIEGLKSLSACMDISADGTLAQFFVGAPEAERRGIVKLLAPQPKSTEPPPFVAGDVLNYGRWRLDVPKTWEGIENTLKEVSPQAFAFLQGIMAMAGKDKDPNFDLRTLLIGNLGDDFITYQKLPRGRTMAELSSPPQLMLVGSPKPDELIAALRNGLSMLIPPSNPIQEREFQGRRIYSIPIPDFGLDEDAQDSAGRKINLAAGGGYLAVTTDEAFLEEYLRSSDRPARALAQNADVKEAAAKVGGFGTGVLGFENYRESMRAFVETVQKDPDAIGQMFEQAGGPEDMGGNLKQWLDFSLLPQFDKIAKYFNISVYTVATTADGFAFKTFLPVSAEFRSSR